MPIFSVEPQALKGTAAKLNDQAGEYERIYKQLIQVASSMGQAYDSEDNKKFVASIEGCCTALQEMANQIRNASEILSQASTGYSTTEEHNAQQASRLGGR